MNGVGEAVVDVQQLSLADGQLIEGGHHQAIAGVERGEAALAPHAIAVLRKQRVITLHANAAAVIDRYGMGIGGGQAEASAETLSEP